MAEHVQPPTPSKVREALWYVQDPELQMSIMELGLVYDVQVEGRSHVYVTMTLTSPACPVGPLLQALTRNAVLQLDGVTEVSVDITFSPPWDPRTMASDDVKMALGIW